MSAFSHDNRLRESDDYMGRALGFIPDARTFEVCASDVPPAETYRRARLAGYSARAAADLTAHVHGLDSAADAAALVGRTARLSG